MGDRPVFIADGHHRYETACNYRDQIHQSGALSKEHPANFVLMYLVAMEDPGMIILPSHRMLGGLPEISSDELAAKLGDCFTTRRAGEGPEAVAGVWEEMEMAGDQGTMGLFACKDRRWLIARLTDAGRAKMDQVAKDHDEQWRGLSVSVLHRLIIEHLLGCTDLPKPTCVHRVEEMVEGLSSGGYPLAAMLMPATVDHVRQISLRGQRMPAKSTYFYPKLLSGLVINPLE